MLCNTKVFGLLHLIEISFLRYDFQDPRVNERHCHHLQPAVEGVAAGALVASAFVLDDQGQRLGVVDHLQQGGDSNVLNVAVLHTAAQSHQRLEPGSQATLTVTCQKTSKQMAQHQFMCKYAYYVVGGSHFSLLV